jgi:hypothetical protein
VKLNYLQAKHRFERSQITSADGKETGNTQHDDDDLNIGDDGQFLLTHYSSLNAGNNQSVADSDDISCFDLGHSHDWGKRTTVRRLNLE